MTDQNNPYTASDAALGSASANGSAGLIEDAPRTFGDTIARVFQTYPRLFSPLLLIALMWGVINALGGYAFEVGGQSLASSGTGWGRVALGMGVAWLAGPYFYILGLKRADNVYRNRSTGDEVSFAAAKYLPVMAFLVGFAILSGFGFLLCIIPGIVITIYLFVGDIAIVLEDRSIGDAFSWSYQLVKDNAAFVFGVLLVTGIVAGIPVVAADVGVALATGGDPIAGAVSSALMTFLVFPLWISINYVLYQALLARNQVIGPAVEGAPQPAGPPGTDATLNDPAAPSDSADMRGAVDDYTDDLDGEKGGDPKNNDDDIAW